MAMLVSNGHRNVLPSHAIRADSEGKVNLSEASEQLVSRKALAARWQCSVETIKRRTREGLLHPVRFNQRMIRYPISEVIRVEQEASGMAP
jgi:hypothetical protein